MVIRRKKDFYSESNPETREKLNMIRAPTVTVVVATYNGESFLMDQLESLSRQTCLPEMVLIGDDGSTDRSIESAREFASRAPFAVDVTVNETRLGYADSFLN